MSDTVLLILACALATYLTRCGGHLVLSRFGHVNHRVNAALDAVPTAVMAALVAPFLLTHGPAEAVAICIVGLIALRVPLMFSVAAGMIAVVGLRIILT